MRVGCRCARARCLKPVISARLHKCRARRVPARNHGCSLLLPVYRITPDKSGVNLIFCWPSTISPEARWFFLAKRHHRADAALSSSECVVRYDIPTASKPEHAVDTAHVDLVFVKLAHDTAAVPIVASGRLPIGLITVTAN